MKKIYFVRHAKSSWEFVMDDFDRPLNTRGFNDADLIGKYLNEQNLVVDAVYSSSANRAETTARIICEDLGIPLSKIQRSKKLYDFDGVGVVNFIKNEIPNTYNSVLIFGHNPCLNRLVNTYGSQIFFKFPTCTVVGIEFNIKEWHKIKEGLGNTFFSVMPKEIR